uniref:Alpha-1,3-glucosyltransferase n=2 Tax=Clastoptera arizonana TaxID=38151 RepID=A0A1B6CZU3_9HEMI
MLHFLIPVFLRFAVSLHSYSGKGKPPMFGDYEAQRHWMEITYNLPIEEWYHNTTNNDLMYWGLDYPPLTAYHSLICGYIAASINPRFVELYDSRGYESESHKLFMRCSVLIVDILIFIPAIYFYFLTQEKRVSALRKKDSQNSSSSSNNDNNVILNTLISLMYPGLILIDYGHFQYNCISLGLFVWSVIANLRKNIVLSSFIFCAAISYKQMELYHSLPFFFYFLGLCWNEMRYYSLKRGLINLIIISLVVIISFMIIWFPFIIDLSQLIQVFHRIFPIARGIFEDKVSNIWCVVNIFYKLRLFFDNEGMAKLCILVTLLSLSPCLIDLFLRPTIKKFQYALINSSLSFFLFSFQVHEKSILLAAIPVLMFFPQDPFPCFWFLLISTFSLLPLMVKDELVLVFCSLSMIYLISVTLLQSIDAMITNFIDSNNSKILKHSLPKIQNVSLFFNYIVHHPFCKRALRYLFYSSILGCIALTVCTTFLNPPQKYLDLFPLLVSTYSCLHFIGFWIYFNCKQLKSGDYYR